MQAESTTFAAAWPRSTMDSIRVSEAPDSGSIPDEATKEGNCGLSPQFPLLFSSKTVGACAM